MSMQFFMKSLQASLHPPAVSLDDDDDASEIPWVLLEEKAYVADCSNDTTASSYSKCGKLIQATFVAARPPRVSYLCVFCRCSAEEDQEMIPIEPLVIATDDNLVLLRIVVGPGKDLLSGDGSDLYIYRPAGPGGPALTRLERPPGDCVFRPSQVGLMSCLTNHHAHHDGTSSLSFLRPHARETYYTVAALCDNVSKPGRGRFILYLYSSKLEAWSITTVAVDDQQLRQYQQGGFFPHTNTKVIAIGGEDGTMGFVDLWRGILLCDLFRVRDSPRLRYVPLPPTGQTDEGDARIYQDIAVDKGHFKYIQQQLLWKPCPGFNGKGGWMSAVWSRPVPAASSMLEGSWDMNCKIESFEMAVGNTLDLKLFPDLQDDEGFNRLHICQPTLSLHGDGRTVCFMVKTNPRDDKSWVILVDMMNNMVQEVAEFNTQRYPAVGFAYKHSRISKYLKRASGTKGNLKRQGMLLPGSANKKQPSASEPMDSER
ncbi:hypothetical protein EJB05_04303 [Eragrostis curvula]|uniref:DUF1618 domain-containing protein n=1 Tax=Eragrostis curvula TaxID=38414 RepID=A0A5J9W811_9POAL|nr:hypothetical protein EJB05_04303 [Eragrostis curvula]